MADDLGVNYDQMKQIATRFAEQAHVADQIHARLRARMAPLEDDGWFGRGADAFYDEMNDVVLPATQRLQNALADTGKLIQEIIQSLMRAENEASAPFRQ